MLAARREHCSRPVCVCASVHSTLCAYHCKLPLQCSPLHTRVCVRAFSISPSLPVVSFFPLNDRDNEVGCDDKGRMRGGGRGCARPTEVVKRSYVQLDRRTSGRANERWCGGGGGHLDIHSLVGAIVCCAEELRCSILRLHIEG